MTQDKRATNVDFKKFMKRHNIHNDIDLFSFLQKSGEADCNLFSSVRKMKETYMIHFLSSLALPQMEELDFIDGSYIGYLFKINDHYKELSILKEGKRSVFTFLNLSYFTDAVIEEILNSIIID